MLTALELYKLSTKIELSEFGSKFGAFRKSAERLELMPAYSVPSERAALLAFEQGSAMPFDFNNGWHDILRSARARGASVRRVRCVPATPTNYIRFEVAWGYIHSAKFGEDIKFITEGDLLGFLFSDFPALIDYWIFDREELMLMVYDRQGAFMGILKAPDLAVQIYSEFIDKITPTSRPLSWAEHEYIGN